MPATDCAHPGGRPSPGPLGGAPARTRGCLCRVSPFSPGHQARLHALPRPPPPQASWASLLRLCAGALQTAERGNPGGPGPSRSRLAGAAPLPASFQARLARCPRWRCGQRAPEVLVRTRAVTRAGWSPGDGARCSSPRHAGTALGLCHVLRSHQEVPAPGGFKPQRRSSPHSLAPGAQGRGSRAVLPGSAGDTAPAPSGAPATRHVTPAPVSVFTGLPSAEGPQASLS